MSDRWVPGRDRRAVRHAAGPGALAATGPPPTVAVVGGGIAGLAAATGLAERGVRVVLLERERQLGGRVRAWPVAWDDTSAAPPRTMSRGFHAFFRQYYNLRALLRRADPELSALVPIADYPLLLAGGHRDSFAGIPRTPPLSLAAFVARSPSFTLADLRRVNVSAALELLDVRFPDTLHSYDGQSAADFLDRLNFPDRARHLALEVFARSFFADPRDFSAGELVAMFHTYFLGSAEGLLFDVPADDYDTAFWAPLGRYLYGRAVDVRTGVEAGGLDESDHRVVLTLACGSAVTADAVVLAADPAATRRLVAASTLGTPDWRERVAAARNAPAFAVWRLWLDRPLDADRAPFLGTSGFASLDNISVVDRFEAGAARWAAETGGSVVELHAYALPDGTDQTALRADLRDALGRIYPETTAAAVLAEEWLVRDDCPLVGTTPWALRADVVTPDPRIVLAGDGVRCDYPVALMERAATTGFLAANTLLAGWGLAGHDLWTVPMTPRVRGLHAARSLAARRAPANRRRSRSAAG